MNRIDPRRPEQGQVLVVFTIALVAVMAMAGLVIDGGSMFVQRRAMQNVADDAALAAGYAYADFNGDESLSTLAARGVAIKNGYAPGTNGVGMSVTFSVGTAGAENVSVSLSKPHANTFSGVVGQSSWTVSTTATVQTGAPNGANGAMPLIFNQQIVRNGFGAASTTTFDEPGTSTQDVPQGNAQFNWTVYCIANGNPCNGDSTTVDQMINGTAPTNNTTIVVGEAIGPLNAGAHATLFSDLANHIGTDFPVAIVDDSGALVGVAMFYLTGSVGGTTKQITGYFEAPVNNRAMFISGAGNRGLNFGDTSVWLIN